MKSNFLLKSDSRLCFFRAVATALLLILLNTIAAAQTGNTDGTTPAGLKPGAPAGAYGLTGFENVNLYNGNLNFSLPLLQVGGRGSAGYPVSLVVEQKWRVEVWAESFPGEGPRYMPLGTWWADLKPGYGPGVLEGRRGGYEDYPFEHYCGSQGSSFYNIMLTRLTFTGGDGTEFELRDQLTNGEPKYLSSVPCESTGSSRGTIFTTADGTAATFISDTTIYDHKYKPMGLNDQFRPSGYLLLRDGTRYRIENGLVMWLRDRNGNRLSFTYDGSGRITTATDSLNRQVSFSYAGTNGFSYDLITYKGFGGQARTIKVWKVSLGSVLRSGYALQTYAQLFPNMTGASSFSHFNPQRVSAVELPDGRSYQLRYNSYGELARVQLPTGGAFEYDWLDGNSLLNEGIIYRRVSERRVYANGTTLESKTTFSNPAYPSGPVEVKSFDAASTLKTYSAHYFNDHALDSMSSEWNTPVSYGNSVAGREYQVDSYDIINNSPVLRRRVTQNWQTRTSHAWAGVDPRLIDVTTQLMDTNQVSKQIFGYDDTVPFNNQNNVKEYAFGNGAPGALVRETRTSFVTAAGYTGTNVHLRSLATQVSIFDGAGIERARTAFEYDNYAADSYHAALISRPSISGFDSVFSASYTTRGNPTAVTRHLLSNGAVTGSVSAYSQYDVAGNVVRSIDPRSTPSNIIATTIEYDDRFGTPDTEARGNSVPSELTGFTSFAFPTKVINALGHTAYAQFDYYLGSPVNSEDANGVVASGYFNDLLDRPTQVRRGIGTGAENQTTFAYDDTNRIVTTSSDLHAYGDNVLVGKVLYDQMGRPTETRQYEGGSNYIRTQTEYDALGRPFKTSNPFRPWQGETAVWTTQAFDGLGRIVSLTTPDNAVVSTSYSGNSVTVTDQAGKKRKSVTDALGRLTDVYEDPAGWNYQTSYVYDVLNSLIKVTQGSQQRYFMYDSLKRLIRSRNPEQSTHSSLNLTDSLTGNSAWSIGYQYDASSNLTQKTDPRGVVSVYAYDALNRNTTTDYSDTASINPDVKRFYDGATNGKGRFWYFYSGGDFSTGSNVDHTSIDSYDALGRPLIQRQLFKLNGSWGPTYQITRGYNRAGAVTLQTYPSGRSVTYNYDSAGRVGDRDAQNLAFTGNLGDSVQRTYARGITYSPWNSLKFEQFGTSTAVYHKLRYTIRGQLCDVRASNVNDPTGGELGALVNYYSTSWAHCGSGTDNNGNVLMSQTIINSYYMEDRYSYDALNRLTAVDEYQNGSTHTGSQQYDYDRYGNRLIKPASWGTGINTRQFTRSDVNNRLGVPTGQSGVMNYDAAGNLTNDTYTSFGSRTYDAENKMTSAQDSNAGWSYYTYNADGQRTRRKINNQETWQIYGVAGELLAEYAANAAASIPQKEYGYRNGQLLVIAEVATNVALAANGATVSASSTLVNPPFSYPVSAVNNGDRKGLNAGFGGNWHSSSTSLPQWVQVDFSGSKIISEVNVFSLQDNYSSPIEPTEATTFSLYGLTGFQVQYWNGSAWTTVPGGTVTGNNKVWKKISFAPITTSKIRVLINATSDGWSRMVEVEAWTTGSSNVKWLVADHLGTPRMIIDQTGTLANVKRHDYLPFGEELFAGAGGRSTGLGYSGGEGLRQQFTAKERDIETGLDYFLARHYSSNQGRFTSTDEPFAGQDIEDPQTWNLYSYTSGNPLCRIDEDGRRWFYKCDGQNGCNVQWVNPNDDGTYTSPGEGWKEFIPTEGDRSLVIYSQDGTQVHRFGENRDGSPRVDTLWTGKVEDASWDIVTFFIPAKISVKAILAGASALWAKHVAKRAAAASIDDILKGATKGKVSTSRQFHKSGGFDQANKDFDALTRGSRVTQRGSVRTAELQDGTKVNVRPKSTAGRPTLEVQPPKGKGSTIKVRYQ